MQKLKMLILLNIIWDIFHTKDSKDYEWHYRGLVDSLKELEGTEAYNEFTKIIDEFFRKA